MPTQAEDKTPDPEAVAGSTSAVTTNADAAHCVLP